jgi:hypothetical protein
MIFTGKQQRQVYSGYRWTISQTVTLFWKRRWLIIHSGEQARKTGVGE